MMSHWSFGSFCWFWSKFTALSGWELVEAIILQNLKYLIIKMYKYFRPSMESHTVHGNLFYLFNKCFTKDCKNIDLASRISNHWSGHTSLLPARQWFVVNFKKNMEIQRKPRPLNGAARTHWIVDIQMNNPKYYPNAGSRPETLTIRCCLTCWFPPCSFFFTPDSNVCILLYPPKIPSLCKIESPFKNVLVHLSHRELPETEQKNLGINKGQDGEWPPFQGQ